MFKMTNFENNEQFVAVYIYNDEIWSATCKMSQNKILIFNTDSQDWDDNVVPAWLGVRADRVTNLQFLRSKRNTTIKTEVGVDVTN